MAEKCESGSMRFSSTVTINGCTIKGIALETNHEPTHRINITLPWGEKKDFVGITPGSCNFYYTNNYAILCKVCLDRVVGYTCYYTVCRTVSVCSQNIRVKDKDTGVGIANATVAARPSVGSIIRCTTGSNGSCTLTNLIEGDSYRLVAEGIPSGYKCQYTADCETTITACEGEKTFRLKEEAPPEYCYQYVRVETSDGKSVTYEITWGPGTWAMGSTPDTSMLYCEKGKSYTATATARGYKSASNRFTACNRQFTLTLTKEVACSGWTTKSTCESHGCFWFDNACHEYGPVKCSDYTDALTCVANNCYWWSDGTCHDTEEAPPVSAYEECGRVPTSSDSKTYITDWWKCAYTIGVKRGICHADAIWWHQAVIADAKTDLGVTSIYLLPQVRTEEGDYVKIWMDGTYLGRFKWKCPSVSVDYGECGRVPTSSDSKTYITNWWKCAYDIAVNRGVCHTDGFWWHREAIKDIKAALGITTIYLLPQTRETDGDYVRIWMEGPTTTKDYYLGRFKWKCPPVAGKFIINVPKGIFGPIGKGIVMVYKVHKLPFIDAYVGLGLPAKDFWCETPPCTFEVVGLEKGGKYAIFPSSSISVLPYVTSKCVYEFTDKVQTIDLPVYIDPLSTVLCDFFDLTPSECSVFLLEFADPIYAANTLSIIRYHEDIVGNKREPETLDYIMLPIVMVGSLLPVLPMGKISQWTGRGLKLAKKTAASKTFLIKHHQKIHHLTAVGDETRLLKFKAFFDADKLDDALKILNEGVTSSEATEVAKALKRINLRKWIRGIRAKWKADKPKTTIEKLMDDTAEHGGNVFKTQADVVVKHVDDAGGDWIKIRKIWDDTVKTADDVVYVDFHLAGKSPEFQRIHNLMRYTKDDYIKALKAQKATVPELGTRFDEGLDFMVRHLDEGGEPSRYAAAINGLSSSERTAIVRNLRAAGKGNVASLVDGVEELGKFHKTGGVYAGVTAIGDDLSDAIKAGGKTKKAARTIVDDSLDFIDEIAKDVDEGKIIEKGLKGKFGARLRPYLNKLSHQKFGAAWDDLRPGQKLKLKIGAVVGVLGYGSFCQFITEESLQNIGWGMGSPFFNKQWDIAEESLNDYKAFHNAMERQMKFCCIFNPLTCVYFWEYIVADREKIKGWERTLEKALAGDNPFAGAKGSVLVKSYPSGAKIYADGIYTNEETNSDIPNLTVGSHVIGVWLDGYIPLQRVVTIEDSKQADCDFGNLPPIPSGEDCPEEPTTVFSPEPGDPQPWGDTKPEVWWGGVGDIDCKTTPTGADIWLDGKKTAFKTNYTLASQSAGRHTITFKKSGYRNCTVSVTVIANQLTPAYCDMTIIKPTAAFDYSPTSPKAGELVTFDATDSKSGTGASITVYAWYCDDVAFGANNIKATKTFAAGSYRIKLRVTNNFRHSDETVKVLTVTEVGVPVGNIKCYCTPADYCGRNADIFVDGNKVDVTKESGYTYIKNQTPGVHTVKYNLLDVMECSGSVTVTADKDVDFSCQLKSKLPASQTAKVTAIVDGDGIRTNVTDALPVPSGQTHQTVRIVGYDAYECRIYPSDCTTFGKYAYDELKKLIPIGTSITLKIDEWLPLGAHNRVIAGVFVGTKDIVAEMLKSCLVSITEKKYRDRYYWITWADYERIWCNPKEAVASAEYKPAIIDIDIRKKTFKIYNNWLTLWLLAEFVDSGGSVIGRLPERQVEGGRASGAITYFAGTYAIKLYARVDKKEDWTLVDTGYVAVAPPIKKTVTFTSVPSGATVTVTKVAGIKTLKVPSRLVQSLKRVKSI